MRITVYLLALTVFTLTGCVVYREPSPQVVTTTTEVRREVVTTGSGTRPIVREEVVTAVPPTVRVETRTVSPGPRYVWTRGYWRWGGMKYEWVPGSWAMRPEAGRGMGRWQMGTPLRRLDLD